MKNRFQSFAFEWVNLFRYVSGVDEAVLAAAAELYQTQEKDPNPMSMKKLSNHIRAELGVNLTVRELERVARTVEGRRGDN